MNRTDCLSTIWIPLCIDSQMETTELRSAFQYLPEGRRNLRDPLAMQDPQREAFEPATCPLTPARGTVHADTERANCLVLSTSTRPPYVSTIRIPSNLSRPFSVIAPQGPGSSNSSLSNDSDDEKARACGHFSGVAQSALSISPQHRRSYLLACNYYSLFDGSYGHIGVICFESSRRTRRRRPYS